MKSIDNEFQNTVESYQVDEFSISDAGDLFETGKEFSDEGQENFDLKSHGDELKEENEEKERQKKRHEKIVKKMSCMVAGAIAVVALSNTLGNNMESNVSKAGGNVNGDLRFSIQWNDRNDNQDDLDAHCTEPGGYEIYYGNARTVSPAGGCLDVDIITPGENVAVENIIYENRKDMEDGTYQLKVNCFSDRSGKDGFSAEVEIRGKVYRFKHNQEMRSGETVVVAEVILENGRFKLKESN